MMKKIIRNVDEEKGIHQVTIADERWYMKPDTDIVTGLPIYKPVPSVTWIAQSYPKGIGYYKWLAEHGWDEAESIKVAAGDKGTKVHAAIEDIMQGKEVRIDSKYLNKSTEQMEELTLEECDCILSFINFKKEKEDDFIVETITFEKTVFSDQYNYAGTVDWIVKLTHKETKEVQYWIIDFKTSAYIWPSHEIQLNGYKKTIENGENNIEGLDVSDIHMGILQVGYSKNKAGYKFTEIDNKFELFLASQLIWKNEHENEKPKVRDYPIVLSAAITVEEVLNDDKKTKTVVGGE